MKYIGADGIITDYPDRALALFGSAGLVQFSC